MKRSSIALVLCACAFAQSTVRISDRPADDGIETLAFRDGSGNTEYVCIADSPSLTSVFAVTASGSNQPRSSIAFANITNITVVSNTATATISGNHGLRVGARIVVEGATVDADLNGTYIIATVGSATTFTFTVASVTADAYTDATLKFSTSAPRSNSNIWAISKNYYTGTAFDRSAWAYGSPSKDKACDSRALYF